MVTRARWDPKLHPRSGVGRFVSVATPTPGRHNPDLVADQEQRAAWRSSEGVPGAQARLLARYRSGELLDGTNISALPRRHREVAKDFLDASWVNENLRAVDSAKELRNRVVWELEEYGIHNAQDYIYHLDEIVEANRLREDTVVYRGVMGHNDDGPLPADVAPGDQFRDPGFQSTSLDPDVPGDFGDDLLEIHLPAGTHVAPMSMANPREFDSQMELTLGRGAVFQVREVSDLDRPRLFGSPPRRIVVDLVGYLD